MSPKTALITGIAGQDGSYLSELLLRNGYVVHGLVRPFSGRPEVACSRIAHVLDRVTVHIGDVADGVALTELVRRIMPDEVYHLATGHEVGISVEEYIGSRCIDTDSTVHLLAAINDFNPLCKFFYASSSNVFSGVVSAPQSELTMFSPTSIYGISKVASMYLVRMYRDKKQLFACSGILFNHESPRRDEFFLTRKITTAAAKIKLGIEKELVLGNLDSRRDWGFSGDFVEAMWLMMQAEEPRDYVVGTGETHSVREVLDIAFEVLGLEWQRYVKVASDLVRPTEPVELVADSSRIRKDLGWAPQMKFKELIRQMAQSDIQLYRGTR